MIKKFLSLFIPFILTLLAYAPLESSLQEIFSYEDLKPIFENYVQVYSPLEKKHHFFTVNSFLKAFFIELKKENLSPHLFLTGSSLLNECAFLSSAYCNDIDIKINYKSPDTLEKLDAALISTLTKLVALKKNSVKELDLFQITSKDVSKEKNGLHVLRTVSSAPKDVLKKANRYVHGSSGFVPLELGIKYYSEQKEPFPSLEDHQGGPNSFYIPLNIFDGQLGSTSPHIFKLCSVNNSSLSDIQKGMYRSCMSGCGNGRVWTRLFMKLTEGFYDPEIEKTSTIPFLKTETSLFRKFKAYIKTKRNFPEYFLFCSINAAFHGSEGDSPLETLEFEKQLDEELSSTFFEKECWNPFAHLCKELPTPCIRTLIKLFAPLLADEVFYKKHLGKDHLQCRFFYKEHPLHLLLPFLEEKDVPHLMDFFSCPLESVNKLVNTHREAALSSLEKRKKFSTLLQKLLKNSASLEKDLKPIFENQIVIWSPEEKREKIFETKAFLYSFISELKKTNFPFQFCLEGSSLVNQCIEHVNLECNDIDVHGVLQIQESELSSVTKELEKTLLATLNTLLGIEHCKNRKIEDFKIQLKKFKIQTTYFLEFSLKENQNSCPSSFISGAESHIPLDFSIVLACNSKDKSHLSIGNVDSFYVPLNDFTQISISSREGDCLKATCDLQKKMFSSEKPYCSNGRRWPRFIIKMTEGFSSPSSLSHETFYAAFRKKEKNLTIFKDAIYRKRKLKDYYLFALINAFFHSQDIEKKDPSSRKSLFTEELLENFSSKNLDLSASPWMKSLARSLEFCPKSHIPTLLKIVIPLWANEVSLKTHLDKKQLRCEFVHLGKKLYLWIPLLEKDDDSYLKDIEGWIIPQFYRLFENTEKMIKSQFTHSSSEEKEKASSWIHYQIGRREAQKPAQFTPTAM